MLEDGLLHAVGSERDVCVRRSRVGVWRDLGVWRPCAPPRVWPSKLARSLLGTAPVVIRNTEPVPAAGRENVALFGHGQTTRLG